MDPVAGTEVYGSAAGGGLVLRRVRVRVVAGPDEGAEVLLDKGSRVIGSGPSADLRLDDRRVSRAHVELVLVHGGVRVRDLGSTNGTFVGSSRLESVVVVPPATVRLGRTRVELSPDDLPMGDLRSQRASFEGLVGDSDAMRRIFAILERVAPAHVPVLLEGEPGVGKTATAHAIHAASPRGGRPLVVLDLGAAEVSEASCRRAFDDAQGTTLLVERLDLAGRDQVRSLLPLLDACEHGTRDVRVVTTSSRDVQSLVEIGLLDRSLYFHLAGVRLVIPALRERVEDIPALVHQIAAGLHLEGGLALSVTEAARLRAHELPGNVRQLRNLVEEAIVLSRSSPGAPPAAAPVAGSLEGVTFKDAKQQVVGAFEREYVRSLLERHDGNLSAAAREAGVVRHHLLALARRHGLR